MNIVIIISFIAILSILAWALFGGPAAPVKTEPKPEEKKPEPEQEPEKIFRRRSSDRAIEEEFPERRRSDDISRESIQRGEDTQAPFELPYSANSIIPDNSRFRMYKRTLINSEIYARKGDIDTAISLFNGVKDRISDKSIKSKIDTNIDYLNRFRDIKEKDQKKRFDSLYSGQQPGELRLKIDGPVPQTINIGTSGSGIDSEEVIRRISGQISKDLGHLKNEIEKIKSKPEERFDLEDYAQYAGLQNELKELKSRFSEIESERNKTLAELNRIREIKEEELALNRERGRSAGENENNELLQNLKHEIKNLNDLKKSLDNLNNRIEEIANLKIPEIRNLPPVMEARYQAPIPVHFDPKPVLDILDRISKENEKLKEPRPDKYQHDEELKEPTEDDFTIEELKQLEYEHPDDYEPDEPIFPDEHAEAVTAEEELPELTAEEEELILAEEAAGSAPEPVEEEAVTGELVETALTEEETAETPVEPVVIEDELPVEDTAEIEPVDETPEPQESAEPEIPQEEITELPEEAMEEPEPAVEEPAVSEEAREPESEEELFPPSETETEIEKQKEKEKEIDRYSDYDEDPNEFDLLSEYGKPKDDSTLTDEEIFEKIITDDKKKTDDSDFEILGEKHKEEQEYSLDEPLDEKKRAEQDFYKKFIKPDRIKKRELPILKVSYDFKKLPDEFSLSREKNILEYSFYKYKPMLAKADDFIKQRRVRDAINYYKVVVDQNIPPEFKIMIKRNIRDLTEYLEKYLTTE